MNRNLRIPALRRFATAITLLTVIGHGFLGFEQAWLVPVVAVLAAYVTELVLELVAAWSERRSVRFAGGPVAVADFLLSAHITGLAVALLLYSNSRMMPVVFASVLAISSKMLFRAPVLAGRRHFLNPSNTGIAVTLLAFPWVGIAPPYMFTENLTGAGDWILPGIIVLSGTFLNARYTGRMPLIAGWLGCFVLQAVVRSVWFDSSLGPALLPMTGVAFLLFTFYMVSDPGTTPGSPLAQIAFGAAVAFAYGVFMVAHVVFGLFFALLAVCSLRGIGLYIRAWAGRVGEMVPSSTVSLAESVPR